MTQARFPEGARVEQSSDVANAIERFYEAFGTASTEAFDRVVSRQPEAMVIGSDRRLDDRQIWRDAFAGFSGVTLEGGEVRAFRHGPVGWAVDEPTYVAPDGRRLPVRLTAVAVAEEGGWKLVQLHLSVAVPDEVALTEAAGWKDMTPP